MYMCKNNPTYIFLQYHMHVATKCFCENEIGSAFGGNGVICGLENQFSKFKNCKPDEWCIGPTNEVNATFSLEFLCRKGTEPRMQQLIFFTRSEYALEH